MKNKCHNKHQDGKFHQSWKVFFRIEFNDFFDLIFLNFFFFYSSLFYYWFFFFLFFSLFFRIETTSKSRRIMEFILARIWNGCRFVHVCRFLHSFIFLKQKKITKRFHKLRICNHVWGNWSFIHRSRSFQLCCSRHRFIFSLSHYLFLFFFSSFFYFWIFA